MEGGGSVTWPLQNKNSSSIKTVLSQLQTKWGELENGFKGWVCKQPWPVEAALFTANHALQGVALGLFYGTLAQSEAATNFYPFEDFGRTRMLQVRNFSILRCTDGALICAMKKIRGGKDDSRARAVAAFTSGYLFQAFTNNPPCGGPEAFVSGLVFAVCQGLLHEVKLRSNSSQPPVADTCYTRTRSMLSKLGLQSYENHFKKNVLTDNTMAILKESDLVKAGIPLGPRILIMNHIEREPDL